MHGPERDSSPAYGALRASARRVCKILILPSYLRYGELTQFLKTIASYVTKSGPNNPEDDARLTIEAALK
jgi:hypothetical protein